MPSFPREPGEIPLPCTSPGWKYIVGFIDDRFSLPKEELLDIASPEGCLVETVISQIMRYIEACDQAGILQTGTDDDFKRVREHFSYDTIRLRYLTWFFDVCLLPEKRNMFMNELFSLVKELPAAFPSGTVKYLGQGCDGTVSLSRRHVAVLLVNALFGTYRLVNNPFSFSFIIRNEYAKTFGILHYFERFFDAENMRTPLRGDISVKRIACTEITSSVFEGSRKKLCDVVFEDEKGIEEMQGMIQADFANKYIGGGVLGSGLVQEEIRLGVFSPEALVSLLVSGEPMESDEAIVITGCEQFSSCTGYGSNISNVFDFKDKSPMVGDSLDVTIAAIDALDVSNNTQVQFEPRNVTRDIVKAYLGFSSTPFLSNKDVATGKWGCGVFGNDLELKFVQQWIACSAVSSSRPRVMYFHTFHNGQHVKQLQQLVDKIKDKGLDTVGLLYDVALRYSKAVTGKQ